MAKFVDYFDPSKPGSFSGLHSFQKTVKKPQDWLKTQDVYTLHKPVRKKFKRRKILVPGPKFQIQSDLIDFSSLKKYNDGNKYILVAIDVFSKVAYIAYLKTKSGKDVIAAFKTILPKIGHFQKLQTDQGTEFLNQHFQNWLKEQNIKHFYTHNLETKASVAERFIRTLKEKLWRFFTYTNSRRYVEVLPTLVEAYNNSYHRSIKRSPNSVNSKNQELVWQSLYGEARPASPKMKVNDIVRLSMTRMQFRKGYLPGWTVELFQIAEAFSGDPPFYKIKDLRGEVLEGTFYQEELQKVYKNDDVFQIERIMNIW